MRGWDWTRREGRRNHELARNHGRELARAGRLAPYMEGECFYKDKNTQTSKIRLALGIASDAHFCDKCLGEGKKVMSAGLATFPNSVKCHLCESCARETVGAL